MGTNYNLMRPLVKIPLSIYVLNRSTLGGRMSLAEIKTRKSLTHEPDPDNAGVGKSEVKFLFATYQSYPDL